MNKHLLCGRIDIFSLSRLNLFLYISNLDNIAQNISALVLSLTVKDRPYDALHNKQLNVTKAEKCNPVDKITMIL